MPVFVPDASVILKWVFDSKDEDDGEIALALLDDWVGDKIEIVLPKLWVFECGNIIGLKRKKTAQETMDILFEYRFSELEMDQTIAASAFEIMNDHHVTFYDAVYHAVAIASKGILVTADMAYYKKAKSNGHILPLAEYRSGRST